MGEGAEPIDVPVACSRLFSQASHKICKDGLGPAKGIPVPAILFANSSGCACTRKNWHFSSLIDHLSFSTCHALFPLTGEEAFLMPL